MKKRNHLKTCKHNVGRTQQAFGCGSAFEKAFKCDLHGLCVLEKVCKKPDDVKVCEKCKDFEVK